MRNPFWLGIGALFLSACATTPAPLRQGPFADVTPQMAQAKNAVGQRVRWGGKVVKVTPERHRTCFEILSRPLEQDGRPRRSDRSDGRFIACAPGFYDPAVYTPKRAVTVVGVIQAPLQGRIGQYDYTFPKLNAESVYLWPKRERRRGYWDDYGPFGDPFMDPFWGPRPFYPGPYW